MTLLNCLQTTFEQTLNWSSKIRKRNREKVINISQERSEELIVSFILKLIPNVLYFGPEKCLKEFKITCWTHVSGPKYKTLGMVIY